MVTFSKHRTDEKAQAYLLDEELAAQPRKRRLSAWEERIVEAALAALPAGAAVADVPCGNGRLTRYIHQRGGLRFVAMDYNLTMLRAMDRRTGDDRMLRRRAQADATRLPLRDKCIDLFVNLRLLHHIADHATRVKMMSEIARVTRTTVITSFWSTRSVRYLKWKLTGRVRAHPISPAEFEAVCRESGLIVERYHRRLGPYEEDVMATCRVI